MFHFIEDLDQENIHTNFVLLIPIPSGVYQNTGVIAEELSYLGKYVDLYSYKHQSIL